MFLVDQYKGVSGIVVKNAGGERTTDWINPTSGLAEDWTKVLNPTTSIVTGNGFTGNAQRVDAVVSSVSEAIAQVAIDGLEHSTSYQFSLKYRCSANNGCRIFWNTADSILNLGLNVGNALLRSDPVMTPASGPLGLYFYVALSTHWFEVDEINLVKL